MASDSDRFDEVDDETLLEELYRRFGASWCSFSAMVREREVCPGCDRVLPLTRHHLRPIAQGAGREVEVRRRYADICRSCHDLAHATWGPGHRWQGPIERELFLRDLKQMVARGGEPPEDQASKRRSNPRMRRFFSRWLSFSRRS